MSAVPSKSTRLVVFKQYTFKCTTCILSYSAHIHNSITPVRRHFRYLKFYSRPNLLCIIFRFQPSWFVRILLVFPCHFMFSIGRSILKHVATGVSLSLTFSEPLDMSICRDDGHRSRGCSDELSIVCLKILVLDHTLRRVWKKSFPN